MATSPPPSYVFPEELLRIPRDGSAVIEASAGTGKTYLLEHLVADRILRGDARLEEMLVVTFTEKATAELVRRLRALIATLLAHDAPAPEGTSPDRVWLLGATARQRLAEAQRAFDRATITTIHGFCQRVLTEDAFASRRLLAQEHVDSKRAFGEAFKEVLRRKLATDAVLAPYLTAWLGAGKGITNLEKSLYDALTQQRPWGVVYDPALLRDRIATVARLSLSAATTLADLTRTAGRSTKFVLTRLENVQGLCRAFAEHGDCARFLAALDEAFNRYQKKDLVTYIEQNLPDQARPGPATQLREAFLNLADAAVPLEFAAIQLILPVVRLELQARKTAAGLYDFDDMLRLVAEALRRPGGGLAESLRRRFRLAIIDEFQDTDGVQWEIFRSVFQQSSGQNPLYLIGDPKQAIYGFRGADVMTYQEARRTIAGGGAATVTLDRNFRSTPAIIAATNAIFDDRAQGPFFEDRTLFRDAIPGRAAETPTDAPAVTLLAVQPAAGAQIGRLHLRHVRQALTRAIADEIDLLRAAPTPPALREMFVLTRSNVESQEVAAKLRERGIPHVLYNQEGLYRAAEARHVRDLLAAIEDPRAPVGRLRVALTPFFGFSLGDLPALAGAPGRQSIEERLLSWRALADGQAWTHLFDRIVDETGVATRELFCGGSARRLTNYLHLFDLLRGMTARAPTSLGELARHLTALIDTLLPPEPQEGNVQRLEVGRDAVQVMTIHKSKGLEANYVFLYGAFSPWGGQGVRAFERDGQRWLFAGRPRRGALKDEIDREAARDDQRLLYVALTRARRRLYLPYAGDPEVERTARHEEDYWRINGAYRHVHRRLRSLFGDGYGREHFIARTVDCPPLPDDTAARLATAVRAWRPAPADLAFDFPTAALAEKRRLCAGITMTSYSRMKQAHGGYQPPTEVLDESAPPAPEIPADPLRLPGGALSGIFLHAVLEKVPLESLVDAPTALAWAARPEVSALFEANLRRHDRDPAHREDAERLVHAALTTPLDLPSGGRLRGVASAERVAREVEFLFPFPAAAGGAEAGFIKGYVDVIFEHQGRTYFGDWKSDLLPDWSPAAVRAHVASNYEQQRRLYALALVKMLGITDEVDYEARFGGTVYVFLRALPAGLEVGRPTWSDLGRWETELAADLGTAMGPS
jgi:exodeoxyribonuclease V beta subunit